MRLACAGGESIPGSGRCCEGPRPLLPAAQRGSVRWVSHLTEGRWALLLCSALLFPTTPNTPSFAVDFSSPFASSCQPWEPARAPSLAGLFTLEGFLKVPLSSSCCVAFWFFGVFYGGLEINFFFTGVGLSIPHVTVQNELVTLLTASWLSYGVFCSVAQRV